MSVKGIKVIDCHHHVGLTAAVRREGQAEVADDTADFDKRELAVRLQTMDAMGTDQAILIPSHGYLRPNGQADTERMNNMIAAYRDRTPERFPAAVGIVEPLHGDVSIRELHRIKDELGLVGVSFHVRFQGVATNSAFVLKLAREMVKIGLVPYVHAAAASMDEDWWKVQDFADAVPDVPVIALDAFGTSERSWEALRVAKATPNIVFDTSTSPGLHYVLPVLDEVGPERIVFGTDLYSSSTPHGPSSRRNIIDQLSATDLVDDDAKRLIFGGNIKRLLGLS